MPSRFKKRILVGIALAGAVMALVALAVTLGTQRFLQSAAWVEHTHQVLEALEVNYTAIRDAEASQRGYLLTGQVEFEQEFFAAIPRARLAMKGVSAEVADNPEQRLRAVRLADLMEKRLAAASATAQAYRVDGFEAARRVLTGGQGPQLMRQIEALKNEMIEAERALLVERTARSVADASVLRIATYGGLAISLLFLALSTRRMLIESDWRARAELETANSNSELRDRVQELRVRGHQTREMSRYAGMLQSCRNVAEAIEITRDTARRLLPELAGSVHLVPASKDLVERVGDWGEHVVTSSTVFPPQDCWAMRRGQTYEVADCQAAMCCAHVSVPPDGLHASTLCIPLVAQGDTMGFVYFDGLAEAAVARRDVATALAEQLSLSLSNLRLQESLRVQSIRDPLTGLFNRRYLEESLERELARCGRRDLPLTVLMLDLDHFKRFNDTHGHDGGDALLAQAGKVLQAQCREEDIACRYGGEEFTLILPELPAAAAAQCAERIRSAIENLQVQHLREVLSPVTASLGMACFPRDATGAAQLLRSADAALYRAKREGRNRTIAAT